MKRIAAVINDETQVDAQVLLAHAAEAAGALGLKVAGVIAEEHGLPDRSCAAGILRDVASGQGHVIYLPETPADTSCHLDPAGVEAACAEVLDLLPQADLVILSKFGKLEAAGSGLFRAFAAAIATDKPVLTSVSARHRASFGEHAPEAAYLNGGDDAVADWLRSLHAHVAAKA